MIDFAPGFRLCVQMVTMLSANGQITQLLRRWQTGDTSVLEELTPLIYGDLRRLAAARLRRSNLCSPTELVHEAFLRLNPGEQPSWVNRAHFYFIAARLMRQVLVDHARRRMSLKRGGQVMTVSLTGLHHAATPPDASLLELHSALEALALFDERKARVLELRYFGGLTAEEIAPLLDVGVITVRRDVRTATAWLKAHLLGEPMPK